MTDSIQTFINVMVELGSEQPEGKKEPESRTTENVIAAMLTENTGRHVLDSGGAYGRSWERNQGRQFKDEAATVLRCETSNYRDTPSVWFNITHNVFHFLVERLDYDEHMDEAFTRWANLPNNKSKYWITLMEEFSDLLRKDKRCYYDENFGTINTYNGEDLVSQTLQYTMAGEYVLLQIHGGADVRGGYTAPRVFRMMDECALMDNARATIYCTNPGNYIGTTLDGVDKHGEQHSWYTDDTSHFYAHNYEQKDLDKYPVKVVDAFDRELWTKGTLVVDDDEIGYCPDCGYALEAGT